MDNHINTKEQTFQPPSLYHCCCRAVSHHLPDGWRDVKTLPGNHIFDILYEMYQSKRYHWLAIEFSHIQEFYKLLLLKHRRPKLLRCFQELVEQKTDVEQMCIAKYSELCSKETEDVNSLVDIGLCLGEFLNEGGWYPCSIEILKQCLSKIQSSMSSIDGLNLLLKCYQTLLYAHVSYSEFTEANVIFKLVLDLVEGEKSWNDGDLCYSQLFTVFSIFFFQEHNYSDANFWSIEALKALNEKTPVHVVIDTLRQASKSFSVEKKLEEARFLINQAVNLGKKCCESNSLRYADLLCDFGFYSLNADAVHQSVCAYEAALEIKLGLFGANNLLVAVLEQGYAYALYFREYTSGRFREAKKHADSAILTMREILPSDHLTLSSAERVKALIIEEIALVMHHSQSAQKKELLLAAERIHKCELLSAERILGEKNVLTAKIYGNLGRLYQSMQEYNLSKMMHLKAIAIKESLLGPDHFEVGLSLGHLASLYNYHIRDYKVAEELYLRALAINSKLFGDAYSGLGYEIKGLIHLYEKCMNVEKALEYTEIFYRWKERREHIQENYLIVLPEQTIKSIAEIKKKIISLEK